jgi:hypothetical protein
MKDQGADMGLQVLWSHKIVQVTDQAGHYLNKLREPVEADPDQRWVGTYNKVH